VLQCGAVCIYSQFDCEHVTLVVKLYHTARSHVTTSASASATHSTTLQHTATYLNTLQHAATRCETAQQEVVSKPLLLPLPLQYTAPHCTTLHHTATHCNTLKYAATRCNMLQHAATRCNTLQHATTQCNTCLPALPVPQPLQPRHRCGELVKTLNSQFYNRFTQLPHSCNTLQHTATHCNTLQHTVL